MTEPLALGRIAKAVLSAVTDALEKSQSDYFEIAILIHQNDVEAAMKAVKDVAARGNFVLRALRFMLADQNKEAEMVVMDAKFKMKDVA